MKPTKQSPSKSSLHHTRANADLLLEAGGDYEMAYYKAREQVNILSATVNQLTNDRAKLLEEKEVFSKTKISSKFEDMERDNSYQNLKQKYDELLDELKRVKIDNKTLQNKALILETEGGAARAESSRI